MAVTARDRGIDVAPLAPLLARIIEGCDPLEIWLFGSRARGTSRPDSDWDLLVVVRDATDDSRFDPMVAWRMTDGLGIPADVILCRVSDFRDARSIPNTLAYEVGLDGVLVYER